jgi:hypothetical protein
VELIVARHASLISMTSMAFHRDSVNHTNSPRNLCRQSSHSFSIWHVDSTNEIESIRWIHLCNERHLPETTLELLLHLKKKLSYCYHKNNFFFSK